MKLLLLFFFLFIHIIHVVINSTKSTYLNTYINMCKHIIIIVIYINCYIPSTVSVWTLLSYINKVQISKQQILFNNNAIY